ncbi:MAG: CotH kinase family protein [Lachnospiraceae bacterium]|jgi:hypothetical protein|nr:CotH kinase family protein [Lachnospiraceae bacterium]
MRKLIAVVLLVGGIALGLVISAFSSPYVLDAVQLEYLTKLPVSLQEDLSYALRGEETSLTLTLSQQEFFYDKNISVSLYTNNPKAEIYYTLDSSTPTVDSQRYTVPLLLIASGETECVVLKAVAVTGNETSPVLTHSYFIGEDVHERFQTDYVFSLSTDAYNLYDYEEGILIEGKTFADFMASNPDTGRSDLHASRNWSNRGREWERPIYVEAFAKSGERIVAQKAGARVYGGLTRVFPQKSLRLVARREYEAGVGLFNYPLFYGYSTADGFTRQILSFDELVLRNDGNDWTHWYGMPRARIRTPLATWIGSECGFDVVSPYAAAAVFLNGEYYGYAAVNVRIDDHFLQTIYNAPERSFDIVEGGNNDVLTEAEEIQSEFEQLFDCVRNETTEQAVSMIEHSFDVGNLLLYYAIQAYTANGDWPGNNVKIWRYNGINDAGNLAKELDGRWRFVLFDLDHSLNYAIAPTHGEQTIHSLLGVGGSGIRSPILQALLKLGGYAEEFANNICDMAYEHFSVQNVERVMEEINKASLDEVEKSSLLYGMDFAAVLDERETIVEFARQRPVYILAELRELFGYTETYRITSDGTAKINTLNGNEGQYFIENSVPIKPILEKGQAFDFWLVNGERRDGEELRVSFADADASGAVHVQCVARPELPPLFFLDAYDNGDLCGFTMYNPTATTQSLRGLYLSDDMHNLKKWPFPRLNVRPGAVWEFVGQNSTSYDSLLKIGLSFNPRYGEAVFLSNEEGEVLDWMAVQR